MPQWVNAYKSLPEKEGRYFIVFESMSYGSPDLISIKRWDGEKWLGVKYQRNVLYWMPLPKMPEGISNNETEEKAKA